MSKAHNGKAPARDGGSQSFDLNKAISEIQNTQRGSGSPVGNVAPFQTVGDLTSKIVLRVLVWRAAELGV
jgi:hypothetical protein